MRHKLLIYLAKKTGFYSTANISTGKIAEEMQISQQSASRILIEMEKEGYIVRKLSSKGLEIKLSEKSYFLFEK